MSTIASSQFSRTGKTAIYLSLVLAVALVVGVLVGAKLVFSRAADQPVGMTELPAPLADSAECNAVLDALPEKVLSHDRAEIAEPAPAGVAAWASSSTERITFRCGIDLPMQYNEYSQVQDIDGVSWLQVSDVTPGSTLSTWYTINRSPVVAVTADEVSLGSADNPVAELAGATSTLPVVASQPNPAPLSQLATGDGGECGSLMAALPDSLPDDYSRIDVPEANTAAWAALGREPVVLRCGVAPPANYEAGARLTQVDDIPWFEDTTLANGTTSSTWFALGRSTDIAVSAPQEMGNAAVVTLGKLIAEHTSEQP
ncbi:hypothetical protein CATRI_05745 [Corynebacterium atrinae]|uniref:DUF3515 domain-containing protein n=1 Tax=Corynebacterium atrinae TaxID=1336740 RepID=UPI0025B5250B|nr:DUF3515 domain-containing protein [Corynebacterium atrinae]WJY63238.1 hypothetical protein CATRI_05745 [Corynebacterium atrinae]